MQAVEECDAEGLIVSPEERRAAGLEARWPGHEADGPPMTRAAEEFLERRTKRLVERGRGRVAARVEEVAGKGHAFMNGPKLAAIGVGGAIFLGFLTGEIGRENLINLLSMPMLGLFVWNLGVYAAVMVSAFRGRKAPAGASTHPWLTRRLIKWAGGEEAAAMGAAAQNLSQDAVGKVVQQARIKFWKRWTPVLQKDASLWATVIFHLGAAGLGAGMVAGMYARGMTHEYSAVWESTFLNGTQVAGLMRTVMAPTVPVFGPLPDDAAFQGRLHYPNAGENAHTWIHRYALMAGLIIGLPRLTLAGAALLGLARLRRRAEPVQADLEAWYEKLRHEASGADLVVPVFCFSHELEGRRRDAAREIMARLWGGGAQVEFRPSVPYGGEDEALEKLPALPGRVAVVMSFSATPEEEVHGLVLRELSSRVASRGDEATFLILLDASAFRAQFSALPEFQRRWQERRTTWERLIFSCVDAALSEDADFLILRRVGERGAKNHHFPV